MDYKFPSWYKRKSFAGVTDEQLTAWERETDGVAQHNKRLYTDALNTWKDILHQIEKVYGLRSKEYRYIDAAKIEEPPDLARALRRTAKAVYDERVAAAKRQKSRERAAARREQRQREAEEARTAWLTQGPH